MIVAVSTNAHRLFFSPKENLTKHRKPNKDPLHNPPLLYQETTLHFSLSFVGNLQPNPQSDADRLWQTSQDNTDQPSQLDT
jgi:hypothetical protein